MLDQYRKAWSVRVCVCERDVPTGYQHGSHHDLLSWN